MLEELRSDVCKANRELQRQQLVTLTWGNVSGLNADRSLLVIKPSGVDYAELTPEDMVVVDVESGDVVEGSLRPSSDTETHRLLYQQFEGVFGVTHTHSTKATVFAQAQVEIPCFGTTHADHFHGPVPVTRLLTEDEVSTAYEANTGRVILERFAELDPLAMPAVLVASHAPFTWGASAAESVKNSVALEAVAEMAIGTLALRPDCPAIDDYLLNKHYTRKHGRDAYYGQVGSGDHVQAGTGGGA